MPVSISVLDNKCGSFSLNPWYLIRCKPCQEARASENLSNIGAEVLLPMYAANSEPRPLFPGYIFGSFPLELFSKVGNAYGVRKVVRFGATLAVVPSDVIDEVRERMQRGIELKRMPAKFTYGDKVLVTDGPYKNFAGIFDSESSRDRVRILLDTVGFANGSGWKTEMHGNFMRLQLDRADIMLV